MTHLLSSYTKLIWVVYMGQVGGKVGTISHIYVIEVGRCAYLEGRALQLYVMTKLV